MTVSRWEAGEVEPRLDSAARYARLLTHLQDAVSRNIKEKEPN
jgi:hypothetical protein